jgi:hypothetical protein
MIGYPALCDVRRFFLPTNNGSFHLCTTFSLSVYILFTRSAILLSTSTICRHAFSFGLCSQLDSITRDRVNGGGVSTLIPRKISVDVTKALARLACMMDVSQEMEVSWLLSSFFKLAVADRMLLVKELNRTGLNDGRAVVLRFAPELLRNCLASAIGSANKGLPSHQIVEGIMQGLSILVDLFYAAREKVFFSLATTKPIHVGVTCCIRTTSYR